MEKDNNNDIMEKIPKFYIFLGIIISLIGISSLLFAFSVLFL